MILSETTQSLELVLGEAKSVDDCDFTVSYADTSSLAFLPALSHGVTNGTTPVTAAAAPAVGVARMAKEVRLHNNDAITHTVTLQLHDGADTRIIMSQSVAAGGDFAYVESVTLSATAAPSDHGLIYLTGGTLATTVSVLDLALPADYEWFHLTLSNFAASDPANDNLCFCFSIDAGATFIGGGGVFSIYSMTYSESSYITAVSTAHTQGGFRDAIGYVGGGWPVDASGSSGIYFAQADLFPGNVSQFPIWNDTVAVELGVAPADANNVSFLQSQVTYDRSAAGVTPAGRINMIRFLPYSLGDTTPAGGHELAAGGSYALWGFKA